MFNVMNIDDGLDLDFDDSPQILDTGTTNVSDTDPKNDDFFEPVSDSDKPISILDEFIKNKGISDSKVVILNDKNEEEEVDFYSLSKEEQLQILNSNDLDNDYGLDNSEIDFLNTLRSQGTSVQDYLESYKQSVINELKGDVAPSYEIDEYTDNELYLLDLQTRYDDLTEDELVAELDKELQNPELFKRKTDKLRNEYKQLEDQYKLQQQESDKATQEADYNKFKDTLIDVAKNTQSIHDIELEDDEINKVLNSLTALDENGVSDFYKSLTSPDKMYELAWYNLYGKEAFNVLVDAYESKIKNLEKQINSKSSSEPNVVIKRDKDDGNQYRNIYHLS